MTFGGPEDGRTKVLTYEYIPGMSSCKCEVRVLRIYDPSGNEREEMPVSVPGWTFRTEVIVGCRYDGEYSHQLKCPLSRLPKEVDLCAPKPTTSHKGNGVYNGPYAFTLTMSPSWGISVADMIKSAQKLMAQKSCPVTKFAWYLEYGKPDTLEHPHIHGMYETATGGKIEEKHFKRMWVKYWQEKDETGRIKKLGRGFVGGYHASVTHEDSYQKYIKKQGGVGEQSDNL